jgi:small subunit ribosomal protein S18
MSDIKSGPNLDDVFDEKAIVDSSATASTTTSESSPRKKGKYKKRKPLLNLKCPLCETSVKVVTYKDVYQLKKFTSVRGKIIHPEKSGVCRKHQRQLSKAIKRARYLALLPYVFVEA